MWSNEYNTLCFTVMVQIRVCTHERGGATLTWNKYRNFSMKHNFVQSLVKDKSEFEFSSWSTCVYMVSSIDWLVAMNVMKTNGPNTCFILYLSDLSAASTLANRTSTSDGSSFMYSRPVNCITNGNLWSNTHGLNQSVKQ